MLDILVPQVGLQAVLLTGFRENQRMELTERGI
jgi:hypothetical protein